MLSKITMVKEKRVFMRCKFGYPTIFFEILAAFSAEVGECAPEGIPG
jgi:hypothetical protein